MARMAAAIVLGLLAPAAVGAAQSAPRGPALNWVRLPGAETCIAPVELAGRVEQRLGRRVFVRMPDAIVVIEGQVAPAAGGGFAAAIRVSDLDSRTYGTRELTLPDADCRRLDDVLALIIAVTIRGGGEGSGIALPPAVQAELDALFAGEPSALDPAELPPGPAAAPAAPAVAEPEAARSAPGDGERALPARGDDREPGVSFGAGAGISAVTGMQADGTIGPSLHLRLRLPHIGSAVLSAALGLAQEHAAPDLVRGTSGSVSLTPQLAALALCGPDVRALASAIALCAHVAVGRIAAEAEGFEHSFSVQQTWLELGPEASVSIPLLGPLYARFLLRLPVRTSRPAFVYRRLDGSSGEVYRLARVGFGGELALGIELF